jgi:hypothetical protein
VSSPEIGKSENGPAVAQEEQPSPAGPIAWRRDLLGVLYAGSAFLLLLVLAGAFPLLVYLGCLVFLPVGVWVGSRSRRPWVDGAIYSGLATVVAAVSLVFASSLGAVATVAALFLALPQGVLGVWLGARLLRWRGKRVPPLERRN